MNKLTQIFITLVSTTLFAHSDDLNRDKTAVSPDADVVVITTNGTEPRESKTQYGSFRKDLVRMWDKGLYHPGISLLDALESYEPPKNVSPDSINSVMRMCELTRALERAYNQYQLSFRGNGFDRDAQRLVSGIYEETLKKIDWIRPFLNSDDKEFRYFVMGYRSISRRHTETQKGIIALAGVQNIEMGPAPRN